MKKQIRLGMIGTGNICCGGHLPQHAQIEDFVVTAMYDVDAGAMAHARDVYIGESCKQKSIAEMKKVPQNLHS